MRPPQVFACSGLRRTDDDELSNHHLVDHALSLAGVASPRVCFVPTAMGDAAETIAAKRRDFAERHPHVRFSVLTLFPQPNVPDVRRHLLGQDLLFVEGGSVVNLMAVWRAHGLAAVLRECWQSGVVLAGVSAGSLCWHLGGPTDSYRDALDPFDDGLGFLPWSNGVHDDVAAQPRRTTYRRLVATGQLAAGYASEDGVGLHYVGTELREAVTVRRGSQAWWVAADGDGGHVERAVPTRYLGA
ncbi:peptidase E [Nocardioides panacis]|uniref:Peptidase E n=1 Tax=Nocardioides panacis TaxID=2849501 RepID=A0A975SVZ7_9ACTN|nr:peptidase E [Nocardioides panacis]QWZ06896.1 peptidase E [Nocardioides panacis]